MKEKTVDKREEELLEAKKNYYQAYLTQAYTDYEPIDEIWEIEDVIAATQRKLERIRNV